MTRARLELAMAVTLVAIALGLPTCLARALADCIMVVS